MIMSSLQHTGSAPRKGSWHQITLYYSASFLLSMSSMVCCPVTADRCLTPHVPIQPLYGAALTSLSD